MIVRSTKLAYRWIPLLMLVVQSYSDFDFVQSDPRLKPKHLKGVLSLMVQFHDFYWPCEILGYQMKLSKIFNFKIVKLINVLLFHKFYSQNQIICPGQRREGISSE